MRQFKPKRKHEGEKPVFGIRAVEEAVDAGKEIEKVLIKKGLQGELFRSFFKKIKELNIPFQFVPVEKLNRITQKNHQGVDGSRYISIEVFPSST